MIIKDVIIIGGGPGAYVAGPILRAGGKSVACIEAEVIGGTCLKFGCMPTKSLSAVSACIDKIKNAAKYGVHIAEWRADFDYAMERAHKHVKKLGDGCENKFAQCGIDVYHGFGSIKDKHTVHVVPYKGEPFDICAETIIIDVGSKSAEISPFRNDPEILDNKGILNLDKLPKSLLIVGSGVMGCEFANIFSNFGTKVTMVELMNRILPPCDADVATAMQGELEKLGVRVLLGTSVSEYKRESDRYICRLTNGSDIETDKILVVVGRRPNTEGLGLENTAIKTGPKGHILVDGYLRTAEQNIYAMGDVIGGNFAHVSRLEGEYIANIILGRGKAIDYKVVPWAIFTNPEIAGVGVTEEQAARLGMQYQTAKATFESNGKAMVSDEDTGFVKILTDPVTKRILGMEIIGPHASDLIHEIALAMKCGITTGEIADMIHIHPTLGESVLKTCQATR